MLRIKAEAFPGDDLRNQTMPDMVALARKTGCSVELKANGTTFWVYPEDNVIEVVHAFDRLYPKSTIVSVRTRVPVEPAKITPAWGAPSAGGDV